MSVYGYLPHAEIENPMIKSTALFWLLMVSAPITSRGQTFHVKNASRKLNLVISIRRNPDADDYGAIDAAYGSADIRIYPKGSKHPFQTLRMQRAMIFKKSLAYNPKINRAPRVLYGEEYSIIVQDFNFDGQEDLAVCDGFESQYGGLSYTVYLFNSMAGKFIKNKLLTRLAHDYLGLFFTDDRKKTLTALGKSGAFIHWERTYKMIRNVPVLIREEDDEVTLSNIEVVTTRTLTHGKWKTRIRKHEYTE